MYILPFFREGRYTWVDGTTVDFMNWAPGEPNNWDSDGSQSRPGIGDEDAVMLYLTGSDSREAGQWNDDIEVPTPGNISENG
jgi:hypothetical protein